MEGLDGSLISHHTAAHLIWSTFARRLGEPSVAGAGRRFRAWRRHARATLGPASGLRAVMDVAVVPLAALLGYTVHGVAPENDALFGELHAPRDVQLGLVVLPWDASLAAAWRITVRDGLARSVRWSLCCNGTRLRVVDVRRSYARHYVEFDLATAERDPALFAVLWALCRAASFAKTEPRIPRSTRHTGSWALASTTGDNQTLFEQVVALSASHGVSVCQSLHRGVRLALDRLAVALARQVRHLPLAEQSLTLIYRLLFLLFAEARQLVPVWHPIYRASYSMMALVDALRSPRPSTGLWPSLQAACRLAHTGCRFEDLVVTPFNGRLFAAAHTPLGEVAHVSDAVMRDVLLALTTRQTAAGREHISYVDLGVEELGAVYERVLDHATALDRSRRASAHSREAPSQRSPSSRTHPAWTAAVDRSRTRKDTATFYTPRSITDFLVRRTLAPLVAEARSDEILGLKVLDPAMGSGAFLVAACRFLADAYERALVRERQAGPGDITDAERATFRRLVAQRCLYGVDRNPMAVQLARLSLWLASLAADAPLTFLDHHLRAGDSLLGASLTDVARRLPGQRPRPGRSVPDQLPLFDVQELEADFRATLPEVGRLALEADSSPQVVTRKERRLEVLLSDAAPLAKWRRALDFWCTSFLAPEGLPLSAAMAGGLLDDVLGRASGVPQRVCDAWRERAGEVGRAAPLFHWPLEFAEVFTETSGAPRADAGFDAVLSNPPWDMLRGDTRTARDAARARAQAVARFVRHSGIYATGREAHVNHYQLFVERTLQLVRRGGRFGLVLPWGFACDIGSSQLRQRLLDSCTVDALVGFENTQAVFPIHRSVRFLLLTASTGGRTEHVPCRFGVVAPRELDGIPDTDDGEPRAPWMRLSTSLLGRMSGSRLTIPDVRSAADLRFLTHLCATAPALGSPDGWNARFGRELHATDDRGCLRPPGHGAPVIEGKQLQPFFVDIAHARASVPLDRLEATPGRLARVRRARLAYRDVASATNRLSLIAAMLPAMTVSTHTVFTLQSQLDPEAQVFLCAIFNSYVANAYIRLFMSSHVTTALLETLPVPRPSPASDDYAAVVSLARHVLDVPADAAGQARLQATVARLYRLDEPLFAHVLAGFPLVEAEAKQAAMAAFRG